MAWNYAYIFSFSLHVLGSKYFHSISKVFLNFYWDPLVQCKVYNQPLFHVDLKAKMVLIQVLSFCVNLVLAIEKSITQVSPYLQVLMRLFQQIRRGESLSFRILVQKEPQHVFHCGSVPASLLAFVNGEVYYWQQNISQSSVFSWIRGMGILLGKHACIFMLENLITFKGTQFLITFSLRSYIPCSQTELLSGQSWQIRLT